MGAQIILCDPHRAVVIGLEREQQLRGITMSSPDIRAGVALLIAALSAQGKSVIQNIEQIDRGYQNIDDRLRALGADIKKSLIMITNIRLTTYACCLLSVALLFSSCQNKTKQLLQKVGLCKSGKSCACKQKFNQPGRFTYYGKTGRSPAKFKLAVQ